MNKKIVFYFLTALVVLTFKIDSSYSIPTIPKYDENYWTSEKMKKAKPLTAKNRNSRFRTRSGVETIKNRAYPSGDKVDMQPPESPVREIEGVEHAKAFPIGKLFMSMDGEDYTCSASVINTDSGNIGISAAHCLYDHDEEEYFENVMFSPGYDNGQEGPLGKIPIARMIVTDEFLDDEMERFAKDRFDWGVMLFNFNMDGHPLQHFTGALGWRLRRENNVPTTIRGYPDGGIELENCPRNGEVLCTWQGQLTLTNDFYIAQDIYLGEGASGSPIMADYDPNTNLGILYSNYASFDEINEQLLGPLYEPLDFHGLIAELEFFPDGDQ